MDPGKASTSFKILKYITEGKLEWASMGDVYDVCLLGDERLEWNRDNKKTIAELKKRFPKHAQQLDKYFDLVNKVYFTSGARFLMKVMPKWFSEIFFWWYGGEYRKYCHRTTKDVLMNEFGFPEELVSNLCYMYGNYGAPPAKSLFTMHCLVSKHYQRSGAYYPVGGSSEIARLEYD